MKLAGIAPTSYIGLNLCKRLINESYNITILDNLHPQIHGANPAYDSYTFNELPKGINFIKGSVEDYDSWADAIKKNEIIIHLAAETGTGQSMTEIVRYNKVNVIGTSLMLEYLAKEKHNVQKVILYSTRALYGEGKYRRKNGKFVYPASRNIMDLESKKLDLLDFDNTTKLELVVTDEKSILNPSSVYGISKLAQENLILTVCAKIL